jgi:hydroxymethylpyrimidine pyrophosphatase-like HAD family hydrolase
MGPGGLERGFVQDEATRTSNRQRLAELQTRILTAVPGCGLASDQAYRELDLAIDFCEDVEPLDRDRIDEIVALFENAGATCKVSSIHVNGWYGDFDKLEGFVRLHQQLWGTQPDPKRWAYFGDSANDAPMFAHFPLSIGVANVVDFLDRIDTAPRWITQAPGGHGFVEGLDHLLSLRPHSPTA